MLQFSTQSITHRFKRKRDIPGAFDDEFALEILESDKLRVTLLISAVACALLIQSGLAIFAYEQFQYAFHGNFKSFQLSVFMIIGLVLVCLLAERTAINRLILKRGRASVFGQYLSAFVEQRFPLSG